jgi:hypothetical protein
MVRITDHLSHSQKHNSNSRNMHNSLAQSSTIELLICRSSCWNAVKAL